MTKLFHLTDKDILLARECKLRCRFRYILLSFSICDRLYCREAIISFDVGASLYLLIFVASDIINHIILHHVSSLHLLTFSNCLMRFQNSWCFSEVCPKLITFIGNKDKSISTFRIPAVERWFDLQASSINKRSEL